MAKLWRWLEKELHGFDLLVFIFKCSVLNILWCCLVMLVLHIINVEFPATRELPPLPAELVFLAPFVLLVVALAEEIFFRLPLAWAIKVFGESKWTLVSAVALSTAFGLAHGHVLNIFVQGVSGLILCAIFLKCGGLQKKYFKALATATLAHAFCNTLLLIAAILAGQVQVS